MTAFTITNGLRLIVHHAIWGMMTIAIVLSPESAGAQVRKSPGSPILSVAADRADGLYHRGEPVNFLVKLVTNGRPAEGVELPWVLLKAGGRDGGIVLQEGRASLRGGRAIVTGTLDEPGFLQCRVEFGNGKETLSALGGAGIDPPQLKPSLPAPDDFDAFWTAQKKQLAAVPINPRLTPVKSADAAIEAFELEADSPVGVTTGYFARPARAKSKSLPAILTLHSHTGVRSAFLAPTVEWAQTGALACDVNPHGLPVGRESSFYTAISRGELSGFRLRGKDARETNYFRSIFFRVLRAIDFLAAQPEWDGRTLVVWGSSMGGAQALAAAGLDSRVTFVAANMPGLCDLTGAVANRAGGWPYYLKSAAAGGSPATLEAVRYYDAVNFASRTRASALIVVGFLDITCPPTTVYTAYNALRGSKEIMHLVSAGHVLPPEARSAMRQAVLRHIADRRRQ